MALVEHQGGELIAALPESAAGPALSPGELAQPAMSPRPTEVGRTALETTTVFMEAGSPESLAGARTGHEVLLSDKLAEMRLKADELLISMQHILRQGLHRSGRPHTDQRKP